MWFEKWFVEGWKLEYLIEGFHVKGKKRDQIKIYFHSNMTLAAHSKNLEKVTIRRVPYIGPVEPDIMYVAEQSNHPLEENSTKF